MAQIDRLPIPFLEIRSLVLQFFRQEPSTQFLSVCNGVAELAVRGNVVPNPHGNQVVEGDYFMLKSADEDTVLEIIWDLIVERVVTLGINSTSAQWPFLRLTQYGNAVVQSQAPIPHDPSGYMTYLSSQVPSLDTTVRLYVQEAIGAYNVGATLASMVMLGCASEKALLNLIDAFTRALPTESARASFARRVSGRMIKRQFDEFSKTLTTYQTQIPHELSENLHNILLGIFTIIRNVRNDSGHPTGKTITRTQAFAFLQVFVEYCRRAHELTNLFIAESFRS